MRDFLLRLLGDSAWTKVQGYDYHDAAQSHAETLDSECDYTLSSGNELMIEIKELGKEDIKVIALYAEPVIRYYSRDME